MQIEEGSGWRLQIDPGRKPYCALIGADDWSVELRQPELQALIQGVSTLLDQLEALRPMLMAEEEIGLELDLELQQLQEDGGAVLQPGGGELHVALEGDAGSWALRFVLTPGDGCRGVEGAWSAQASQVLAAALKGLELADG